MKRAVAVALLVIASTFAGFAQMRGMRMSAPARPMARPPMAFSRPAFAGMRPGFTARPMVFAPRPAFAGRPGFGSRPRFAPPRSSFGRPRVPFHGSSFPQARIIPRRPNRGAFAPTRPRPFRGNSPAFFGGHQHHHDFDFDADDFFDGDLDDLFLFNNQFAFASPFLFGGFSSPFLGSFYSPFYNPFFGDAFFADYGNAYSNPPPSSYDSEVANSSVNQLSSELRDLSSEVDLLREQDDMLRSELERRESAAAREAPSANLASIPSEPPVVLVFRDGHRTAIQNYAIVGQTVWILSDKKATKVPLAELDIDQTTKVNRDRGLNFSIGPSPH